MGCTLSRHAGTPHRFCGAWTWKMRIIYYLKQNLFWSAPFVSADIFQLTSWRLCRIWSSPAIQTYCICKFWEICVTCAPNPWSTFYPWTFWFNHSQAFLLYTSRGTKGEGVHPRLALAKPLFTFSESRASLVWDLLATKETACAQWIRNGCKLGEFSQCVCEPKMQLSHSETLEDDCVDYKKRR